MELSCKLLDSLASLPDADPTIIAARTAERSRADFVQLRQALTDSDPEQQWGGLRLRELPEKRGLVYLCVRHRQALHYPAGPAGTDLTPQSP